MQRILELDGIRGTAILLVIANHYIGYHGIVNWGPRWGWTGVQLFFVLSGFLITSILLRTTGRPGSLRAFYARRSLRIFPLYYLMLLILFSASAAVGTPQSARAVAIFVLFLQAIVPARISGLAIVPHPYWAIAAFSVFWSLSVEEYFYIVWSPFVRFTNAHRTILWSALILILIVTPWIRFYSHDPRGRMEMLLPQMDSLAAGSLLSILWRDHAESIKPIIQRNARWIYAIIIGLIGAGVCIDFATGLNKPTLLDIRIFNSAIFTVMWLAWSLWLLVTLAVSGGQGLMPRLLRSRILCWFGRTSYCLYVIHGPIFVIMRRNIAHRLAPFAALLISCVIASISLRYFEGPIARWKDRAFRFPA